MAKQVIVFDSEHDFEYLLENSIRKVMAEQQQPPQPEIPDLVPIEIAAEITMKAKQTLYGLVSDKVLIQGLHYFKQGKKLYFSRKGLLEWIQKGNKKIVFK